MQLHRSFVRRVELQAVHMRLKYSRTEQLFPTVQYRDNPITKQHTILYTYILAFLYFEHNLSLNSEGWKLHDNLLALYAHRRASTEMLNLRNVIGKPVLKVI